MAAMDVLSWVGRELLGAAAPSTDHAPAGHDAPSDDTSHGGGHGGHHAGPTNVAHYNSDGTVTLSAHACFCEGWYVSHGTPLETTIAHSLQWMAFAISVLFLGWYGWQTWRATCGWEEVYVCAVELIKVCFEIFHEFDSPCTLYLSTGNSVLWLRYAEWLLTCPVILIHLSNLTGLADDYSKRTMRLLVSDIGTIVWGVSCAMSDIAWLKIVFFILGLLYSSNTFFHAAKVFIESYHQMPKGICRLLVRLMAWCFFTSWAMFPILFLFGPEAFGKLSAYGSTIATTMADILSKNLFGMMGHWLRVKIREHILLHGDIRKKVKLRVAGEDMEVDTFVEEEDDETIKHSTKALANRESFLLMRDNMKAKGFDVRASLDNDDGGDAGMAMMGVKKGFKSAHVEPGRVILAVPDISMVEFFREQFAALPAPIELVPALGADNALQLVQQALQLGGLDFVLVHPEFLRDRSQSGLAIRLKMFGQRVCAFGWTPAGPARELIESANLDGWLEGPSFGAGVNQQQLAQLVGCMQALRKQMMFGGMLQAQAGGGSFGGGPLQSAPSGSLGSTVPLLQSGGSRVMMPGSPMGGNTGMMSGNIMMGIMGANSLNRQAANPLFGSAPSPLNSQPGMQASGVYTSPGQATAGNATPPVGGGGAASEAEMLQQLMNEINRLKTELGEGS